MHEQRLAGRQLAAHLKRGAPSAGGQILTSQQDSWKITPSDAFLWVAVPQLEARGLPVQTAASSDWCHFKGRGQT